MGDAVDSLYPKHRAIAVKTDSSDASWKGKWRLSFEDAKEQAERWFTSVGVEYVAVETRLDGKSTYLRILG